MSKLDVFTSDDRSESDEELSAKHCIREFGLVIEEYVNRKLGPESLELRRIDDGGQVNEESGETA